MDTLNNLPTDSDYLLPHSGIPCKLPEKVFSVQSGTQVIVWLRQKYKYHSQVWAVTKGFLLILHPVIRDGVKV